MRIEFICEDPLPPQKVKFSTYGAVLLKIQIQHLHMFTNNNWNRNLWIRVLHIPTKDMQTSPLRSCHIHMNTAMNQMKNQFSDFYFLSYGWLYLRFTVTHLNFQVCHRPKQNSFKSCQNFRKDAQFSESTENIFSDFCDL